MKNDNSKGTKSIVIVAYKGHAQFKTVLKIKEIASPYRNTVQKQTQ